LMAKLPAHAPQAGHLQLDRRTLMSNVTFELGNAGSRVPLDRQLGAAETRRRRRCRPEARARSARTVPG
jgi:hypothetical protein